MRNVGQASNDRVISVILNTQWSKENRANEIDWFTTLCGFPVAIMDSGVQWIE